MPPKDVNHGVPGGQNRPRRERRKAVRLRELVDRFQGDVQRNRHELELQFRRIAQIQMELEALRRATTRSNH
jgi:hypothetical protein